MKSILICDDDADIVEVLADEVRNSFPSNEVEVSEITNSIDALIKITETQFDLIITDHKMPTMTGVEFLYNMKNMVSSKNKNTSVIFLSGFIPDVKSLLETQDDIILMEKPYKGDELVSNIKKLIGL